MTEAAWRKLRDKMLTKAYRQCWIVVADNGRDVIVQHGVTGERWGYDAARQWWFPMDLLDELMAA